MTTFNATWDLSDVKKNGATESSHDSVIVATAKRAQPRLSPPVPSSGQKTKQASWNVAELTRLVESWLTAAPNELGSAELIDTGPFGLAIEALADELLLLNCCSAFERKVAQLKLLVSWLEANGPPDVEITLMVTGAEEPEIGSTWDQPIRGHSAA